MNGKLQQQTYYDLRSLLACAAYEYMTSYADGIGSIFIDDEDGNAVCAVDFEMGDEALYMPDGDILRRYIWPAMETVRKIDEARKRSI